MVEDWEVALEAEALAEKRRVAPGWLDREEKILQPDRSRGVGLLTGGEEGEAQGQEELGKVLQPERKGETSDQAGEELDRAFGALHTSER